MQSLMGLPTRFIPYDMPWEAHHICGPWDVPHGNTTGTMTVTYGTSHGTDGVDLMGSPVGRPESSHVGSRGMPRDAMECHEVP